VNAGASVKVTYWAEQLGDHAIRDLSGIDAFHDDLEREYAARRDRSFQISFGSQSMWVRPI
jgi:hypothetical protein